VDLLYLTEATSDLPREPIATYLLGRRTLQTGDAEGAIGPLKTSLALLEDDATRGAISLDTAQGVEAEAWRLLAHALLHTRALLDAEAAFARASHLSRTSEHRAMNLDWAARASWLRTHRELQEQGVF
jgi:cytochrome c-type biogenesis protein CcmH/NrfG